jgi:hypothetical protein
MEIGNTFSFFGCYNTGRLSAFVTLPMSITFSLSLFPKPEVFNFKLIYLNQQNFKKKKVKEIN